MMEINKHKEGSTITTHDHDELCSLSEMLSSFCSEDHNPLNPLQEVFGVNTTSRLAISEPKDVNEKPEEEKDKEEHCNKNNRTAKRQRALDYRVMMEKKRRQLIKDKIETLEGMTPNCAKSDISAKLESIAEHIKSMKHQIDVMSMAYTDPTGYMQQYYGAQAPLMSPWGYYARGIPMMPNQNMPYIPQFQQVQQDTAPPKQTRPKKKH